MYSYRCDLCGLEQDFLFKMGEAPYEFTVNERVSHDFRRIYTPPAHIMESSGDGYFLDSKSGLTSRGRPKKVRW